MSVHDMDYDDLLELADVLGVSVDEVADVVADMDYFQYSEGQKDIEHAVYLEENGLEGFDPDTGEFY